MANADRPQGFRPYGEPLRVTPYACGGTIVVGDAVKYDAGGDVVVAAASNALLGVAMTSAVDGGTVLVADHPDQLFVGQSSTADIGAQTDVNLNYNIVAGSANSYGVSGHEILGSSGATSATLPLRLMRIEPRVDNAYGANVDCIVKINNHQLGSHTGTAGV